MPETRLPVVSVITPTLNSASYIEETIQSILNQDYPSIEHIIIDGGSTDGTQSILQRYPHLKWISEPDSGQSDAINKGFRFSHGEIIAWLNADDTYKQGAIRISVTALLSHPEALFVYGDCDLIDEKGSVIGFFPSKPFSLEQLLMGNYIPQPTVFLRRSVLEIAGYLDTNYHYVMDYDWWLRIGCLATASQIPGQQLANFRLSPGSKSMKASNIFFQENLKVVESLVNSNPPLEHTILEEALHYHALRAGLATIREGNPEDAKPLLERAFDDPNSPQMPLEELAKQIVYDLSHLWGLELPEVNLEHSINNFFSACPPVPWLKDLYAQTTVEMTWNAHAHGDREGIRRLGWLALKKSSNARRDRGLISIWIRSVAGLPLLKPEP